MLVEYIIGKIINKVIAFLGHNTTTPLKMSLVKQDVILFCAQPIWHGQVSEGTRFWMSNEFA